MNTKLRFAGLAVASLLAGASAVAFAQSPAPVAPQPGVACPACPMAGEMGPHHGYHMGQGHRMGPGYHHGQGYRGQGFDPARFDARMNALAGALKLQANQQAAWDAYAGKIKAQAESRTKLRAEMAAVVNDRQKALELRAEHMKANAAAMSDIAQSRAALIAVLSPEQKTTLDAYGRGGRSGGRGCGAGV